MTKKKTKTCTRCVDRNSNVWFIFHGMNYGYAINILDQVRNDYREKLARNGYVTLIDILSYLDLSVSRESLKLGWVWDDEENYPDLDLFITHNGDREAPFDHKITIKFVGLVDLSRVLDSDTALE